MISRIYKCIISGIIAGFFIAILVLQASINYSRVTEDLEEVMVIMPGEFITNFVIGGFRGLAVDLIWLKIDELWHIGRWFDIIPLLRAVTWMQPHFLEAWELGAWHLVYNCHAYAEAAGIKEKDMYLEEGIRFIKEGLARNRNVYNLWFNLGWIYYHKLKDHDEGIRYFRAATRYKHPSYIDRLIAHAYRKKGEIESEYKEWQRCLTVFTDDAHHMQITKENLERTKKKLIEAGKL
jgi:tetratricopeptide (TPR) repeat protein